MATVRKTITLTNQQDSWVKAQIDSSFTNDSELIRREQECTAEIESIRQPLIEGEKSGEPQRFDPAGFKQRMQLAHG